MAESRGGGACACPMSFSMQGLALDAHAACLSTWSSALCTAIRVRVSGAGTTSTSKVL